MNIGMIGVVSLLFGYFPVFPEQYVNADSLITIGWVSLVLMALGIIFTGVTK